MVTTAGNLVELEGHIWQPRKKYTKIDGPEKWKRMYYRARSKKWNASFKQAAAYFAYENFGQWPNKSWPLMPLEAKDWWMKVAELPSERLNK